MATNTKDHYAVLGLHYDCDHLDITFAYKKLILEATSIARINEIQTAYDVLNDLDSRDSYDKSVLWKTRRAAFNAEREDKNKHRRQLLQTLPRSSRDWKELTSSRQKRKDHFVEFHKEIQFQREQIKHYWSRARSDSDRIRILTYAKTTCEDMYTYIEDTSQYVSQRYEILSQETSEAAFAYASLRSVMAEAANINKACKAAIAKLGTSTSDSRPVLGERRNPPAQFWRLSKELVNAQSLEQHMEDMEDRLRIMEINRDDVFTMAVKVTPDQ